MSGTEKRVIGNRSASRIREDVKRRVCPFIRYVKSWGEESIIQKWTSWKEGNRRDK